MIQLQFSIIQRQQNQEEQHEQAQSKVTQLGFH